jgi:hypothetical protein
MSLEFHNGSWRRMCPGCGTRGCRCKWVQGALYLSCTACDSEFCLRPKARSEGRGVWVRRLADSKFTHYSGGLDDASQSGGCRAGLCGTEEPGRQGLQIGGFLCEGQRSGVLRLGIPEDQMPLIEVCKQAEGKQARASIEVRKFEQTGRVFFDLSGLEVLK